MYKGLKKKKKKKEEEEEEEEKKYAYKTHYKWITLHPEHSRAPFPPHVSQLFKICRQLEKWM